MSLATHVDVTRSTQTIADLTGLPSGVRLTGTGLDGLLTLVATDRALNYYVSSFDIQTAISAMGELNAIVVQSVHATGVAADGEIGTPDVHALSEYISTNFSDEWAKFHGDDEGTEETGFHLVQNDGARSTLFGENAVNTVIDGLYHLGFGSIGNNLINEDGNRNVQVDDAAFWLNALLAQDIANGVFANDVAPAAIATTGTGLDALVAMIMTDERLNQRLSDADLRGGAQAANTMNTIIIEGIKALGLANDGTITASNVTALSDWIRANYYDEFVTAHGDDEGNEETGFHLVQNDGANTRLFGENGVNTVADGIYHLVFGYSGKNLINEDGNRNANTEDVADWLNRLLADDLAALANPDVAEKVVGTTGSGLDRLVSIIVNDDGLNRNVSDSELRGGAEAANTMNTIIVEGINALALGDDGKLTTSEILTLSDWIAENYYDGFVTAHGDDEGSEETGFHLVQNDGGETQLFGNNAVNTVADGIYHLVFGYDRSNRLVNEDGNANARVETVAYWLNELLAEDLENWRAAADTGNAIETGLDQILSVIVNDPELNNRLPLTEILDGMAAAQGMNAIIIEAIKATGVAANGTLSAGDVRAISDWINTNRYDQWVTLHGDDENGEETGFHLVQNDGAVSRLYGENAVNTVADGIYHLGFGYNQSGRLINEDGNANASTNDVAYWLNDLLADALADGSLRSDINPYDVASTGTGLDAITNAVFSDAVLSRNFATSDLNVAATAADGLNTILLQAIHATGTGNNGAFDENDVRLINAWIAQNAQAEWNALYGADSTASDGFGKIQREGAVATINNENVIDKMARLIYAMGNTITWNVQIRDANGSYIGRVEDAANYLNILLADELASGTLTNADLLAADPASFADALVLDIDTPMTFGNGENALLVAHDAAQEVAQGAIAVTFTADTIESWRSRTLVSKDFRYFEDGGHLTILVRNERVEVRLESEDATYVLTSPLGMLQAGVSTDIAVNFGENGAQLYLDGALVAENTDAVTSWLNNDNPIAIGESRIWAWNDGNTNRDLFDGEISLVQFYNRNLTSQEVLALDNDLPEASAAVAVDLPEGALQTVGNGLSGTVYDVNSSFSAVEKLITGIDNGTLAATHTFTANAISFSGTGRQSLTDFLSEHGTVTSGEGSTAVHTMGMHLTGYIWLDAGEHTFTVRSDDGFALEIGGTELISFSAARAVGSSIGTGTFTAGLYQIDLYYYENAGSQVLDLALDGEAIKTAQLYTSIEAYLNAAEYDAAASEVALTGTGLDQIVDWISEDGGLQLSTLFADRAEAIEAAKGMNQIIVEAIKALGAADDGTISTSEVYDIATWINENRLEDWGLLHGDDDGNEETGFHLVQNDGGQTLVFGQKAINTVADGIYHLGFGYKNQRLINEDGNNNAKVEDVADWLNHILAADLADGTLASGNDVYVQGTTGTGLDELVEVIATDTELGRRIPESDLIRAANAMNTMNALILEGVQELGLANDGVITAAEVAGLSDWVQTDAHRLATFIEAHGDDEGNEETGFHLVQNDGAYTRLYSQNAINTVADGIYHLPFGYAKGRLINEDGNTNASLNSVAEWLSNLLVDDMGALANPDATAVVTGTTGTGLDDLVSRIGADLGLQARITLAEINEGAAAADGMNHIIVDSIKVLGYANDGTLTESEIRGLSEYIAANYADGAASAWLTLHGDDENNEETGFHLVQNDGANARIFNENLVNTVADGIYHLGFGYNKSGRLINEDGNSNQTIADIADWLNTLLTDDMTALANADVVAFSGSTGTGLDQWVDLIMADIGLNQNISINDITTGAFYADQLNTMIVDGIITTGIARNGGFSASDIRVLSDYIAQTYYGSDATSAFAIAHGDDENDEETGFHLVQNDGATAEYYGENLVNTVLDGVYHLGFGYNASGRLINEDGNSNQRLSDVAYWLEAALAVELTTGALVTEASANPYVTGKTGTGLDALVNLITEDDALNAKLTTTQIAEAASAADGLNTLLLEAITATDVARDGALTMSDLKDISVWLQNNYSAEWAVLNGSSASGFGLSMDARTGLFGERAVQTVMDGLYNLGYGYRYDRVVNEAGGTDEKLSEMALWLSDLLADELADGSLVGPAVTADSFDAVPFMTRTDLSVQSSQQAELRYVDATAEGSIVASFTLDEMTSGSRYTLFSRGANGDADGFYRVYMLNGELRMDVRQGSHYAYLRSDQLGIEAGKEYTAALSYDGDTISLYLNGVKVEAEHNPSIDFGTMDQDLMLGAAFSTGSAGQVYPWWSFDGTISALSVYDEALSNTEMDYLNTSGSWVQALIVENVALAAEEAAMGDGLNGAVFDVDSAIGSVEVFRTLTEGTEADITFDAKAVEFTSPAYGSIDAFVASSGDNQTGDGSARADTFGLTLDGFIFVEAGTHSFDVYSDDGFSMSIGEEVVAEYAGLRSQETTRAEVIFTESGYYQIHIDYFENGGAQVLRLEMDNDILDEEVLFSALPELV
ncbi:LamG-like jellyroll fold domain-containing protein [Donghicola tyrosinivorans]|uniref:PA14 domain-containing protein n=1 Tax=Donghicola tyrosinivorans TaxID=1652492 RepID=A0A2T0WE95_9RHOB|nr:LamG-like jellyroll fold domain-containing protein [Donghicola tyrosinivorans]PRY85037.1 PA14 domain-containing protein [Donghicola tyrosinivorans]